MGKQVERNACWRERRESDEAMVSDGVISVPTGCLAGCPPEAHRDLPTMSHQTVTSRCYGKMW
ncbi:hypothetical protein EYF80_006461 [Liparis tanakae]|uniref:Uncharacterized protein n=1 Tax=Liparis tanakae TaxID=230148 RepID=A0A4Z2IZP6_9TELE|nr:hypothetical protein EYF80_006461 [Liparis tanakae]